MIMIQIMDYIDMDGVGVGREVGMEGGGDRDEVGGYIQSCLVGPVPLEKPEKQRYPQLWPPVLLISPRRAAL